MATTSCRIERPAVRSRYLNHSGVTLPIGDDPRLLLGVHMSMKAKRPFRFGLQAFEATSAAAWLDVARRAEGLGYSTLFTTDHYFGPGSIAESSGHRPVDVAPITAMTAAAMATTTLRVGCRVFNVDLHQPVVLAKEMATLDMISNGRLEVGLGAGWVAAEYAGMGIAMDRPGVRIDRLGEVVEVLKAFWSGADIEVDGTYVHASGFTGCRSRCSSRIRRSSSVAGGRRSSPWPAVLPTSSASTSTTPPASSAPRVRLLRRQSDVGEVGVVRAGAGDRFADVDWRSVPISSP